jgi:hypothetical protein
VTTPQSRRGRSASRPIDLSARGAGRECFRRLRRPKVLYRTFATIWAARDMSEVGAEPEVTGRGSNRRFCEGFRMTAHGNGSASTGAVVRKPPGKEPAGDELPTVPRVLWRFDCAVDGGRKAQGRSGQVKAGVGGTLAHLSTDEDSFRGSWCCGKRCRAAVRSGVAVAGL